MRTLAGFVIGFGLALAARRTSRPEQQQTAVPRMPDSDQDEDVAARVEAEWKRLGLQQSNIDATVIDGALYVRGKAHRSTADALVATARPIPGVKTVVDEIKRS